MQHAILDFLGTALVPELGADVAAGSPGYAHLVLVPVAAVGAFPYQLAVFIFHDFDFSVVAADHAVVALGVQFGVHDIFINVLHHREDSGNIGLHVRHFDVGNGAAGGEFLEV